MKKITSLLTLLLLCIGGAWATDVTVINSSQAATTYGSLSGETFTTNSASGLAGLTVSGIKGTTATNFAYGACLALTSTASGTITITAPDGYNITGYSLTAKSNTYKVPYTLTPAAGGSAVETTTTGVSLTTTGLSSQSASFTYSAASANSFYIPSLTVTVVSASAQLVEVTYNLYDVGDMVNIKATEVKTQEANSAINIPSSFVNDTYFEYTTSGTIGDTNCTISVVRTPKNGVVYPLSNLSNNKAYTLTTARGTLGTNGTQMVSTNGTSFTASNFAIISYEGNYYLWSVADSKWVSANSQPTLTTNVDEAGKVVLTETNAPYFFMGMGSLGVNVASGYYVSGTNQFSGIVVNDYTTSDPGNQYVITEAADFDPTAALQALADYYHPSYFVTYVVKDADNNTLFTSTPQPTTLGASITELPSQFQNTLFYSYNTVNVTITDNSTTIEFTATLKADAPFKFTADATSPVWYVLKLKDANYPTYVEGGTPNVTTPTTSANNQTVHWAFVGSPYEGFHIINRAAGTSLVLGSASAANDGNNGGNTYATLAAEGTQAYELWFPTGSPYYTNGFYLYNGEGIALNQRNTANFAYWTGGQGTGSTFVATLAPTDSELYDICITQLESINWGTGLNQYSFTGTYAGYTSQAGTIIDGLKTQGYSAYNLEVAQALLANYALNLPQAGMFIRIKSAAHNTYLSGEGSSNSSTRLSFTSTTDDSNIFYFDGSNLCDYAKGRLAKGREVGVVGDAGVDYWFEAATGATGQYVVRFNPDGGTNRWLYAWGSGKDYADQNGKEDANCRFVLEEVTTLDLTLTDLSAYYASGCYTTMYMPVKVQVTGATVYAVTGATGNSLDIVELTDGVVPANTGVILEGTTTSATATVCDDASTATSVLQGSVPAIVKPTGDDVYVLSVANSKLGFYKFAGTEMKGFRAYYVPTSGNADPTRGFVLNFGETTGVGSVVLGNGSSVYDLQGRRVNNAQKGVFIINGKKVVK